MRGAGRLLRRRALAAAVAAGAGLAFSAAAASRDQVPPPPALPEMRDPLPVEKTVKDPLFAVLLGILETDDYGVLRGERLDREVRRRGASGRFLYGRVAWISRRPEEPGRSARIELQFLGPLKLPFPYSILGYHPGSVRSTSACRLREWQLGEMTLGSRKQAYDVRVFSLDEGEVLIDVDGWLDLLSGDVLDDARVSGLAVLRQGERRLGLAFGYNKAGEPRHGMIDFVADKVLFPPGAEFKGVPRDLRRRLEALASGREPEATVSEVAKPRARPRP